MHPFEQLIYDRFAQNIAAWNTEKHPDIWAVSFLCDDTQFSEDAAGEEFILQGQICLSYNTLSHLEEQIAQGNEEEEAKWNFAYWPQEYTACVPRDRKPREDPPADELALRDAWCNSFGIVPDDTDGGGRPIYDESILNEALYGACQRVAQALHQNGVIQGKIGRPIPILIQDLEQSEGSVAATLAANPSGLFPEIDALR